MNETDELLTKEEVAGKLKCSLGTVQNYINANELPAFQIKRRWRIRASALNVFIAKREAGSGANKQAA